MMNQTYLYVALIGVIFVLYALTRSSRKSNAAQVAAPPVQQAGADEELKAMLDEFMNELEKDNARLLDSFAKLQNEYKQQMALQKEVIAALTARVDQLEKQVEKQAAAPQFAAAADDEQQSPEPASFFAFNEKYAKVVELSRDGRTAEQIARETGMGLGEINLVLGLAKREENLQ